MMPNVFLEPEEVFVRRCMSHNHTSPVLPLQHMTASRCIPSRARVLAMVLVRSARMGLSLGGAAPNFSGRRRWSLFLRRGKSYRYIVYNREYPGSCWSNLQLGMSFGLLQIVTLVLGVYVTKQLDFLTIGSPLLSLI